MGCQCLTTSLLTSMLADEFLYLEKVISNEAGYSVDEAYHGGRIAMLRELLKELNSEKKENER